MLRTITLSIFIMIFTSGFAQVRQGSDGLYCDSHGKLFTGTSYEYYADSVVQASIEITKGIPDGLTKIYFENGNLEEVRPFHHGLKHGTWEKWNRQGIKIAEAGYYEDLKDGKWYVWDDSGTLRYDMTYDKGQKTGTWLMFDELGKPSGEKKY